jgi:hypothetical protein
MTDISKVDIICIIILILFLGFFIRVNITFPSLSRRKGKSDDYEDDEEEDDDRSETED